MGNNLQPTSPTSQSDILTVATIGIIVILAGLVIDALIAGKFENIAEMKGHHGYFVWCLLFGPIGWLMVWMLPDRGEHVVIVKNMPQSTDTSNKKTTDFDLPDL